MTTILDYTAAHEGELTSLLKADRDWDMFTRRDALGRFHAALSKGPTYVALVDGRIGGYVRAITDPFGVYVSELYVAPAFRGGGVGRSLLRELKKSAAPPVYVLSDEDRYYEKLGCKRIGSVFEI